MCGRYAFKYSKTQIDEIRSIIGNIEDTLHHFQPTSQYNIAPNSHIATIIGHQLTLTKWGLIPSWVKEPENFSNLINARSETLTQKPSFKGSIRRKRCIIPANGFFEWGKGKTPFYFKHKNSEPLFFAGIFDEWEKDDNYVLTSSIITVPANSTLKDVHDRMPAILESHAIPEWLDNRNENMREIQPLLKSADNNLLEKYEVSKYVNSPLHDDERCIARVSLF